MSSLCPQSPPPLSFCLSCHFLLCLHCLPVNHLWVSGTVAGLSATAPRFIGIKNVTNIILNRLLPHNFMHARAIHLKTFSYLKIREGSNGLNLVYTTGYNETISTHLFEFRWFLYCILLTVKIFSLIQWVILIN